MSAFYCVKLSLSAMFMVQIYKIIYSAACHNNLARILEIRYAPI
jgi:hypothetical protein